MKIDRLEEILLVDKPSILLKENEAELFKLIPELKKSKGFNQNNDWHIYDVYEHILHVVDYTKKNINVRYAALFHDIGKPYSYKEDENGIGHFYGHWDVSNEIFKKFTSNHKINSDINIISNLILYHDKRISNMNEDEINKLKEIFDIEGLELLFNLKEADVKAQNPKYIYYLDVVEEERKKIL